jgi:hypothetical protein
MSERLTTEREAEIRRVQARREAANRGRVDKRDWRKAGVRHAAEVGDLLAELDAVRAERDAARFRLDQLDDRPDA